jgi:hypothetical protein
VRTEVLELDEKFGEEFKGRYVFQEITWAKRSRIIQKYTKYHPISGQIVNSDYIAIQAETIWASLKEQPPHKPVSLEKLLSEDSGVPIGLGELFSQIVNKLCSLTVEENRFLSEPSEDKNQTRFSQNSASAKNSGGHQTNSPINRQKLSSNSSPSSMN